VSALLSAELLKLRTTRMVYGLLGALLAIVAVATVVGILATDESELERDPEGLFASPLSGIVFVLLLGVMLMSGEFRHGTITQTLLATPVRWKVLVTKIVAAAILGFVFAVIAEMFALVLGWPTLTLKGVDFTFNDDALRLVVGNIGAMTIAGPLGVALGSLIRNQVAAIVVVFAWLLVLEPLLGAGLNDNEKFLPGSAIAAIVGADQAHLLSPAGGVAVLLAYVVVLAAVGGGLVFTRDVNSIQA
jgi:ABC-type transport system involved in multi-copper enzyme maturation permease subunit